MVCSSGCLLAGWGNLSVGPWPGRESSPYSAPEWLQQESPGRGEVGRLWASCANGTERMGVPVSSPDPPAPSLPAPLCGFCFVGF